MRGASVGQPQTRVTNAAHAKLCGFKDSMVMVSANFVQELGSKHGDSGRYYRRSAAIVISWEHHRKQTLVMYFLSYFKNSCHFSTLKS